MNCQQPAIAAQRAALSKKGLAKRRQQAGFTLVEVLVAFVIFALGMLGAAGLQLYSMKTSRSSANMIVAATFAKEYGEIMQSVPSQTTGSFTGVDANSFFMDTDAAGIAAIDNAGANACVGTSANCDAVAMRNANILDWQKRVAAGLPKVVVKVCQDSAPVEADTSSANFGRYKWACNDTGNLTVIKMGWQQNADNRVPGTAPSGTATSAPLTIVTLMGNTR